MLARLHLGPSRAARGSLEVTRERGSTTGACLGEPEMLTVNAIAGW